ncbi:MAG: hypothetical protein Q4G51_06400 [Dermatophilus congolensis]|nr:hypothetical protein [Dermatophilus congolensis]
MSESPRTNDIPTSEQAAALLAQADAKRREVAHFSPAMTVYAVLCTSSGLGILLLSYTQGQQRLAGMIAWLSFVAVGAFMPLAIRANSGAARGFGKRWGVLMGMWGVLWGVSVAVTTAVASGANTNLQIVVPVMCSVAFLVLMVMAVASEASRVDRERRALRPNAAGV